MNDVEDIENIKNINIDNTEHKYVQKRIDSIDIVKGLAILLIMLAHLGALWLDPEWRFVYGFVLTYADFFGPGLFVLLSALSVVFSVRRKQGRVPEKVIQKGVFIRGFSIIVIGMFYNLAALAMIGVEVPFPLNFFGWNILMFLGFSQIFSYYSLKLKKVVRAGIGLFIIFVSEYIREVIYLGMEENIGLQILHFIIVSPTPMVTLLPWLAICFIGTIFGDLLHEAMIEGTEESYLKLFRQYLLWGIILTSFGMIIGWRLETPETMVLSEYTHLELLLIINRQPYYQYPGMYNFLIRGTASNMFFLIGINLLVMSLVFYLVDIKGKSNALSRMFKSYGIVSLTLFLLHQIFLPLYISQLNLLVFIFVAFSFLAFMGIFMRICVIYFNGVGSAEWLMGLMGGSGKKK